MPAHDDEFLDASDKPQEKETATDGKGGDAKVHNIATPRDQET